MFKHILVGLDGSPSSEQALKQAISLATLTGASLTVLSVEEKLPAYAASMGEVEDAKQEIEAFFKRVHQLAQERARVAGVKLNTAIRAGHAAAAIVRFAEDQGFDLIVLGVGEGRGLGSTADKVAETAPCSVLIARPLPLSVRVSDIMSAEVAYVEPDTPLVDVVKLMIQRGIKAAPVVDGGQVVGMITDGDLLRRAGLGLRLSLQRKLSPEDLAEQLRALTQTADKASAVMTSPAVTISADARVAEAVRLMLDRQVKRLPVVDKQGALIGMISRTDILAAIAASPEAEEEAPGLPAGLNYRAGDLVIRDIPTVLPDTPLNEVLDKLVATPFRRVVVVDPQRRVLGIILDGELLSRIGAERRPDLFHALLARLSRTSAAPVPLSGRAADVMSRDVFTVQEDTPFVDVVQLMLEKHVKRLVVTDAENRLLGMVDRRSLLQIIGSELRG
jgi:CBS domain-containing protein